MGTNDAMKIASQRNFHQHLQMNLGLVLFGGGILGYAQFPGGASSTDGVVIDSKYLGTTGTAAFPST
jgi:hypothetical protein